MEKWTLVMLGMCSPYDAHSHRIPKQVLAGLSIVQVVYMAAVGKFATAEWLEGFALGLLFWGISKLSKESIGYGDAWIITLTGMTLGVEKNLLLLYIASLIAMVWGIWKMANKHQSKEIAFVPCLLCAYIVMIGRGL